MINQDSTKRRPRRIWIRLLLGAALVLGIFIYLAFVLLPILAQRGSLNQVVEGALQSVLSVPVTIESVETDPLSEFSITRVSSVSSAAENRFVFRAARVTAFYRPLDLVLDHRLAELTVERPTLFLNLDEDLSGIVKVSPTSGEKFQVGRFRISDGRLEVRLGGRDLVFQDLDLDATGIGGGGDLGFRAVARGLGARLTVEGLLARLPGIPGDPPHFHIVSAKIDLEDLHLEPLAPFLPAAGFGAGGQFSLTGTAGGTWPDHVEARFSSRFSDAQIAPSAGPRLEGGSGIFEVTADLFGALRKVEFHARLDTEARVVAGGGSPENADSLERLSLRATGAFFLGVPGQGGPRLEVEEARLDVSGLGEATASGNVVFKSPESSYSLELRVPGISLSKIGERAHLERLRGLLSAARGTLGLTVTASGTLSSSRLLASFSLADAVLGSADRPLLSGSLSGKVEYQGSLGESNSSTPASPPPIAVDFEVARGSLTFPGLAIEAPDFTAGGKADFSRDAAGSLRVRSSVQLKAKEIGWGPVVENADEQPIEANGEVVLLGSTPGGSFLLNADIRAPSTGTVSIRGAVAGGGGGAPDLDLQLLADSLPTERFVKTWLSAPFKEKVPFLEGARFKGRSSIRARVRGRSPRVSMDGMLSASAVGVKLTGAEIEGLDLELPFRFGGAPDAVEGAVPGVLRIARLSAGKFSLGKAELPFQFQDRTYRLSNGPAAIPLLGGELAIEELRFAPSSPRERVRLRFTARELKVEEVTRLLGIREIPGRILFEVQSLTMTGDRLDIDGRLLLDVFGGSLALSGLSIDHPFSPYRSIRLRSGAIRDFNLATLGEQFRFGVASGVLDGQVTGLELLGTEIVTFEAEFETIPRSGVSQYLNKAAIESIQRIFSGAFGGIEDVFFSRFRFAGFGFWASVKNGGLRLRGKYDFGGTEYLMYPSWYQFPKVSIINTHPGIVYDWEAVQANLKSISQRPEGSK